MAQFQPPPHQPVQYAYPYGGPPPMKNLTGIATATKVMLCIMGVVAVFAAYTRFDRKSTIEAYLDGDAGPSDLFDADDRVVFAMVLYLIGIVATGIVFIIWQYRHAKNAEALGARAGLGPGWAIGGWFIPLASFALPGIQLFQSSKGSNPQRRGAGIVIAWAIVFGLANVGTLFAASSGETDSEGVSILDIEGLRDLADSDSAGGGGFSFYVIAAVLAAVMVTKLTNAQSTATPAPGAGQYSPPGTHAPPPPAAGFGAPPAFGAAPPPSQPPTGPPTAAPPAADPPQPPSTWTPPDGDIPPPG